jgi:alkanesulfonate monooxygenase SsuD/methylene tetrahydromethanopterin reductase-like flavin-dependent oxidoreductase (luciferase family)
LNAGQDPDAHPRLQAATRSIQAANAALRLAVISNRDSPEIGVVAPVQKPYPPIWVGGHSRAALRPPASLVRTRLPMS